MSGDTFGQLLRRLREAKIEPQMRCNQAVQWYVQAPLSQNELALRAGLDAAAVHKLESGGRITPKRSTVEALAAALDLNDADTCRLLIAAGYWPWSFDAEMVEVIFGAMRRENDRRGIEQMRLRGDG